MKKNEEKLLEIAKTVIEMNTGIEAALTGSLMLLHNYYHIRREATDIDIICSSLWEPNVPTGFKLLDWSGKGSHPNSVVYKNEEGIKIDFMLSEERRETVNGILCGSVENLVRAKLGFARNDKDEKSRMKLLQDIIYLIDNNVCNLHFNL